MEQNIEHCTWYGPVVGNIWLASHMRLVPWPHEAPGKWLSESLAVSIHPFIHLSQSRSWSPSLHSKCEGDLKAQRQNQIKPDRTAPCIQLLSGSLFVQESEPIRAQMLLIRAGGELAEWVENRHRFSLQNASCLLGGRTNFTTFRINACSFGAVPLRRRHSSGEGWNLQIPFKGSCWKSHPASRRAGKPVGGWRRELTWRRGCTVTRYSTRRRTDGTTFSFFIQPGKWGCVPTGSAASCSSACL